MRQSGGSTLAGMPTNGSRGLARLAAPGIAANRIDDVKLAFKHLPADISTPDQVHRLSAWLAAKSGDSVTERRELEHLIAFDPSDLTAIDRLAQLAENDGQPDRAAELMRKKAEIDRLRGRYEKLYERKQPIRDAIKMARLAEQLGRRFEARVFLTVAISDAPDRADLRQDLGRLSQSSSAGLVRPDRRQSQSTTSPFIAGGGASACSLLSIF